MKTSANTLFAPISNLTIATITTQVKETLAIVTNPVPAKTFSSADFWNIRRKSRSAFLRRSFV